MRPSKHAAEGRPEGRHWRQFASGGLHTPGARQFSPERARYFGSASSREPLALGAPGDASEHEAAAASVGAVGTSGAVGRPARAPSTTAGLAPLAVHEALQTPGEPLDSSARMALEPQLGHDFSGVTVHTDAHAAESARALDASAYTVGRHIVFDQGHYRPGTPDGRELLAHELTHVAQQERSGSLRVQRQQAGAAPPTTSTAPTIVTMRDFIGLVRRVEADNPGLGALEIAQRLFRTKYSSTAWEWLLPSTRGGAAVASGTSVTAADVGALSRKLVIDLPNGGRVDALHIIAGIVANAERRPAGTGATGLSRLVGALPSGVSQRGVATWVGDVGQAAAEYMWAHPSPRGSVTRENYRDEFMPQWDLIGDIDSIAMSSTSSAAGFAFDASRPLSDNLERFYFPTAPREGQSRRFHTFCSVEGFALEADGVTLSAAARSTIETQVGAFTRWFAAYNPSLQMWIQVNSPPMTSGLGGMSGGLGAMPLYNPIWSQWATRGRELTWFVQQFVDFVQSNLRAEGP